jgi:hypothetical protein
MRTTHQTTDNRGVPDDQQVVLTPFKLENGRLEADSLTSALNT